MNEEEQRWAPECSCEEDELCGFCVDGERAFLALALDGNTAAIRALPTAPLRVGEHSVIRSAIVALHTCDEPVDLVTVSGLMRCAMKRAEEIDKNICDGSDPPRQNP